ncbi:hypothetical protein [Marilutibacter alkalisoli]|uniref:hypothetical protein n=1 Tax=Marilutibacter alkalisoli TaxID=2591633 RepID=UPI00141E1615|nr:hypothetical protein [Lysobacter alkalisoli]
MNTPRNFGVLSLAAISVALIAAPSPASADEASVKALSEISGVSERHVRMVLGARTPYPEYRIVYDRKKKQLEEAIGPETFNRLLAGDKVELAPRQAPSQAIAKAEVRPQERQP